MLFDAKLKDDNSLKIILDTVSKVSNVALFDFSEDGFYLRAYDDYFVSIIHVDLRKDFFAEFNPPAGLIQAKIDLNDFKKILSVAGKDDEVKLSFNTDTAELKVIMTTTKGRKTKREYVLTSLIYEKDDDPEESDPYSINIYELEFNSKINFESGSLKDIIPQVSIFAEEVKIDINKKLITFSSESEKKQKSKMDLEPGEDEYIKSVSIDGDNEKYSIMFQVLNLNNLVKIDSIASETVMFSEEAKPGLFIFKQSDLSNDAGETGKEYIWKVGVMIAPVTEDEDSYNDEEEENYDDDID